MGHSCKDSTIPGFKKIIREVSSRGGKLFYVSSLTSTISASTVCYTTANGGTIGDCAYGKKRKRRMVNDVPETIDDPSTIKGTRVPTEVDR